MLYALLPQALEPRSNYESIIEDYNAARLQAANAKGRGDKKSQEEAGLIIRKLKKEISALGSRKCYHLSSILVQDLFQAYHVSFIETMLQDYQLMSWNLDM